MLVKNMYMYMSSKVKKKIANFKENSNWKDSINGKIRESNVGKTTIWACHQQEFSSHKNMWNKKRLLEPLNCDEKCGIDSNSYGFWVNIHF